MSENMNGGGNKVFLALLSLILIYFAFDYTGIYIRHHFEMKRIERQAEQTSLLRSAQDLSRNYCDSVNKVSIGVMKEIEERIDKKVKYMEELRNEINLESKNK